MSTTISARQLLHGNDILHEPRLTIEDGYITAITTGQADTDHSFPEGLLIPSYVNLHVHGSAGHDVMEGTSEALRIVGTSLASHGVGAYYPTTVTSPKDEILRALDMIASVIERGPEPGCSVPLGIHLEGPFLSEAKRGVHPAALLIAPSVALFDRFWQAARGHISIMTIAPELPNALELIEHARKLGVVCSLGHSNATLPEAAAGFGAGARTATHTFNAMRALDHRNPGIAAYVLDNDALFAELICDGIHVDPAMVRLYARSKGSEKAVLVTDGMSATGMPDGRYLLGELEVEVSQGHCTSAGSPGVLAGSVLTMDKAVRNFSEFTGAPLELSVQLASRNPSHLMGLTEWGTVRVGREANLVALSPEGKILQSFYRGQAQLN